ncbi:MAG: hypothetical protein AAB785_02335 [Patescibacteria group bacterium]
MRIEDRCVIIEPADMPMTDREVDRLMMTAIWADAVETEWSEEVRVVGEFWFRVQFPDEEAKLYSEAALWRRLRKI